MKKFLSIFLLGIMLVTSGCASKLMNPVNEGYTTVQDNKANVIFFRSSSFGGAIQAPIAEDASNGVNFVGISSMDTKIQYKVEPGEHTFVVSGESAQIVKGVLAANKNYYVRISPRIGVWKARFHPNVVTPEELAKESVQKEIRNCKLVAPNTLGQDWFAEHRMDLIEKLRVGKEKFDGDKDQIILENYGVDQLY